MEPPNDTWNDSRWAEGVSLSLFPFIISKLSQVLPLFPNNPP